MLDQITAPFSEREESFCGGLFLFLLFCSSTSFVLPFSFGDTKN